ADRDGGGHEERAVSDALPELAPGDEHGGLAERQRAPVHADSSSTAEPSSVTASRNSSVSDVRTGAKSRTGPSARAASSSSWSSPDLSSTTAVCPSSST